MTQAYLPIFLRAAARPCWVIGGGAVAARKVAFARRFGAAVTVIAPELCAALEQEASSGAIRWLQDRYHPELVQDPLLVFAATDQGEVNAAVAADGLARGWLVNVADDPGRCGFILPSIVDRDPLVVAVSSGGQAPVLARLLRARLETFIPGRFGDLARLMGRFRARVREVLPGLRERRRFWEEIVQGPVAELMLSGRHEAAVAGLERALDGGGAHGMHGEVYLVGAGPGDPDLLTFRALRLMQQADVVLYDRLVAPALLDLVRREAERIYVGKSRAEHVASQEEINELLVRLAQAGHRVLRLKGGDPFTFGRGGEEIETLAAHGIPFQVVPGITAALGCAAYAGIPLTHRDYANSCVFVTAHMRDGGFDLNWQTLVQPRQTLAIYMGVHGLAGLCAQLIAHGLNAATPAAIVERGTQRDQRVIVGTLADIARRAEAERVRAPALTIVGEVVRLRDKLAWYEQRRDR